MSINRKCCCGALRCAGAGACCTKIDTQTNFPCYGTCVITRIDTTPPTVYSTTDFGTSGQCQLPPDWRDGNGNQLGDCICYTANYPPQSIGLTLEADCNAMVGQTVDVGAGGDQNVVSVNWDDNEFLYTAQWTAHAAEPSGIYFKNCFPPQRNLTCTCRTDLNRCQCEALNGSAVGRSTVWIKLGTCPASCLGCTCERGDCIAIAGGATVESECAFILRKKTRNTTWKRGSNCSECVTGAGDTDTYQYKIAQSSGTFTETMMNNCTFELGISIPCQAQTRKFHSWNRQGSWTNYVESGNVELIGSTIGGVYTANTAGIAAMAAWVSAMQSAHNYSTSSSATNCPYDAFNTNETSSVAFVQATYTCPKGCNCFNDTFYTYTYVGVDPVTGSDVYCETNILYPITSDSYTESGTYNDDEPFSGHQESTMNMSEIGFGCNSVTYSKTGSCCNLEPCSNT